MKFNTDFFNESGVLSKTLTGYTPRHAQIAMAEAISQAVAERATLVVEAGTGTGKTFGYLIPILCAGTKTIISTGTKNLQDQLFFKDVPFIKKILSTSLQTALLKGRMNYVCLHRLNNSRNEGRLLSTLSRSDAEYIYEWSLVTQSGDIAELESLPEDAEVWPHVTSTVDNCLNQDCEFYKKCFLMKAREQARNADIVIVNHHLFFADAALQDEGFGELLPATDVIVFDEAHQVPEIAAAFFSTTLTSRQLIELCKDSENEALLHAKDAWQTMAATSSDVQTGVVHFRSLLGSDGRRSPWPGSPSPSLLQARESLYTALVALTAFLETLSVRHKSLENCWKRAAKLCEHFNALRAEVTNNIVHWYETWPQGFSLQATPILIGDYFKQYITGYSTAVSSGYSTNSGDQGEEVTSPPVIDKDSCLGRSLKLVQTKKRAWIFTSATLTVSNSFNAFTATLGLEAPMQLQLESPFNYREQALLYVPRGLPSTHDAQHHTQAVIDCALPVITAAQGRTFLLFTSHRAMQAAAAYLQGQCPFPLLLQGSMPKQKLIQRFIELGNAVLLGTSSFWYGVDVRGRVLSCVIIDKLPFAAHDDPIVQGRIRLLRQEGKDPFYSYQLPQAVIALKQGAGRLIRTEQDKGVLMICDPRLVGMAYGDQFLKSLPRMPRTRDLQKVQVFLSALT